MKKLSTLIAAILISIQLFAQAPEKMSYQAVIRNASNVLVTNSPVKMRISILHGSASGNAVYSELHSVTTNANGLATIEVGNGTSQQGTFSNINWGNGTYFLKIETDPANGTNYSIVGTSQLLSVPYALESNNAKIAENAKSADDGIKGVSNDTLTLNNGDKYVIPGIKKIGNLPSTINNGLIAYYPFNGNANDESGNGNNGTVDGATLTNDRFGNENKAYRFDGNSNSINCGTAQSLINNQNFSYSFWLQRTSADIKSTQAMIISNYGGNFLGNLFAVNGTGADIRLHKPNSFNFAFGTYNESDWTHFTATKDSVYLILYKNGSLVDKVDISNYGATTNTTFPFVIGKFGWSPGGAFKGLIDDIRVYNRALTQEEITYLANDKPFTSSNTTVHNCGATEVHNPNKTYGTVTDVDGNTYKTIQIGTQIWFAENLKTTKYRNGVVIPNVTDNNEWANNTTGAYCSYNNNTANDCPYGKLYNWYAFSNSNNLCPTGWHIPSDSEWNILLTNLDLNNNPLTGSTIAGGKMKNTGTRYWSSPNTGATNSSGWSGLPGGDRNNNGTFNNIQVNGSWWLSTNAFSNTNAIYGDLYFQTAIFAKGNYNKAFGLSVRCIKD